MIFYLVTKPYRYTMRRFLTSWGRELHGELRFVTYRRLRRWRTFPAGSYIFSDLERLTGEQNASAQGVYDRLSGDPEHYRLLNEPARCMRRYELLHTLHECGLNDFEVHRPGATPCFPVYLRGENDHRGSRTPLLRNEAELTAALHEADYPDPLITEFCDTSDGDGVFRKYAAVRIGDRIIARHLFFSRHWMIKRDQSLEWMVKLGKRGCDALVFEELAFVGANPHEDGVRRIFELARIEYGRIDYAFRNGRMQVWEINTNPMLATDDSSANPARRPTHELAVRRIIEAFRATRPPQAIAPRRGLLAWAWR